MAGDGCWSVELRLQRRCSGGGGPLRSVEVDRQPSLQLPALPWAGGRERGPLALATTNLLTVATERAHHPGVATIPTTETKDEGFPALREGDLPMAGNRCCYHVETGCPANDSLQATRSPDCLLRHPPRPGTEPYGQLTTLRLEELPADELLGGGDP